ncbi:MAG TPA: hypothetical protein VFV72_04105 [Candidatus Limnocylindrales bacterium]|nr:hypothetical protein [Candidatus Limnocylindrales bacterium]
MAREIKRRLRDWLWQPLLQPVPWVVAAILGAILSVLWVIVVGRFLSAGVDRGGTRRSPRGAGPGGLMERTRR